MGCGGADAIADDEGGVVGAGGGGGEVERGGGARLHGGAEAVGDGPQVGEVVVFARASVAVENYLLALAAGVVFGEDEG